MQLSSDSSRFKAAQVAVAIVASAALSVTGCGRSSTTPQLTHQRQLVGGPVTPEYVGAGTVVRGRVRRGSPGSEPNVSSTATRRRRARLTPNEEPAASPAKLPNPCLLVSSAEVHAIVGIPVSRQVQAPLGPTCIYMLRAPVPVIT